ncbi:MAG: response regulator, partial [Myxococcales bacterium]|nr:response regulator [Myxococcales bacterium]
MTSTAEMERLRARVAELEQQLERASESIEVLEAIRAGEIDALVVEGAGGPETYTLRSADHPYRVLVEQIGEGALIVSETGNILFANACAEELVGRPLAGEALTPLFVAAEHERIQLAVESGTPAIEATLLKSDGASLRTRLSIRRMSFDDFAGYAIVVTDLSHHDQLVVAQAANEAKERFLSVLGHEIRNPLSSLSAALNVIQGDQRGEIGERMRSVMLRQVGQISALVNDLLDVARIDQGKLQIELERIDLALLVAESLEAQRVPARDQGISLRESFPDAPVWVDADPTRVRQAIDNLLSNAFNATGRDGVVSVRLTGDEATAAIAVEDEGCGIESENLERIFEPFAQGESSGGAVSGLGLGLPLTRALIEAHRGRVTASSAGPGEGATFVIELPRKSAATRRTPDRADPGATTRALEILIVDDHRDTIDAMQLLLEQDGHRVESARRAGDVLPMIESRNFDLILCDLALPDEDGRVLARRIR